MNFIFDNMDILRYILLFYSFIGFLVVGGLIFNRKAKGNMFLAIVILVFTCKQLAFLYETSDILSIYPQLFMITFPMSVLFGPALYLHIKTLTTEKKTSTSKILLHLLPFLTLVLVTVFFFTMDGKERLLYINNNITSIIIPFNFVKAVHISIYGLVVLHFIRMHSKSWMLKRKYYAVVILIIYVITAVLQAYFYTSSMRFKYFIIYHCAASTLTIFIGYVLYFHPELLKKINEKYLGSSLSQEDIKRICDKIENFVSDSENLTNPKLNLEMLANAIEEKKHHISQAISEGFQTSFNDLINQKRVEHSKTLLVNPVYNKFKIEAIALDTGYKNKGTFNRAFIKFASCTPSEFRKRNL